MPMQGEAEPAAQIPVERARASCPGAVFVVTTGSGSLDKYAERLAERLAVDTIEMNAYEQTADLFNVPLFSARGLAGIRGDVEFARKLRSLDARLLHLPNHHLGRYGILLSQPYVVTVHDLIRYFDLTGRSPLIHKPNLRDRLFLRQDYAGIRRADAIIAVSETTKRDVVRHLAIPEDRVFVVYEGIDHNLYRPVARRRLDPPYILYVGSEHPRKNLSTLLRAFARLKREPAFRDLKLVKVGAPGGPEAPFREQTLRAVHELELENDVVFTGRVPEDDLPPWYSGAACLVFPSLYEGFGFPPLEAMACGCPAIVSNAASLPEVVGDAAVVVAPRDDAALADAIRTVLAEDVREDLAQRGLARAAEFSWDRAARETVAVYEAVLGPPRPVTGVTVS